LLFASLPAPVQAQLVSERVDGLQRVCVYRGTTGLVSGADREYEYRVGLAQNCPGTIPTESGSPLPPTARLQSERQIGQSRICTFEEGGRTWQRAVSAGQACPLAAGLLPAAGGQTR
jgi:hypothetical protein